MICLYESKVGLLLDDRFPWQNLVPPTRLIRSVGIFVEQRQLMIGKSEIMKYV